MRDVPKLLFTRWEITGKGAFPIDMLRHEQCWPATDQDSKKIRFSLHPGTENIIQMIEVETFREGIGFARRQPDYKHWSSHGWDASLVR